MRFLIAFLMSFTLAMPAFAENLTMIGTNSTATKIIFKLHSQDRKNHVWPDASNHYYLNPGQTANFKISCNKNEKICYGAKRDNNSNSTWGVGYKGTNTCKSCCYTCDNSSFKVNLINSSGT